ncbi:MAG: VOC family protein, partial [Nitratireductor sp.]|nr:VOC family protein [Nitratireductor sp.]
MPIPPANLYPPFNIVRLSHVELNVTDLAWARAFYVDTLGLQVTHEDTGSIYLRALEERGHHCMILKKADSASANVLGFKVWDEHELDKASEWFQSKGRRTEWIERPYMGRVLRTSDLFGVPLEFYAKMDRLAPIHQKYKLYHGVKPLRIDHFNCFAPDVDKAVAFYNAIGFRVTEYTEDDVSKRLWAAWMHRKGG